MHHPPSHASRRLARPSSRPLGGALIAALVLLLPLLQTALPASALAANYEFLPCPGGPFGTLRAGNDPQLRSIQECVANGQVTLAGNDERRTVEEGEEANWHFEIPAFAELKRVSMDEEFFGPWQGATLAWRVGVNPGFTKKTDEVIERSGHARSGDAVPESGPTVYTASAGGGVGHFKPNVREFFTEVACEFDPCPGTEQVGVTTTAIVATVTDDGLPETPAASGPIAEGKAVSGTQRVEVTGADRQSGVFVAKAVTGTEVLAIAAPNDDSGGLCAKPFATPLPCLAENSFSLEIETGALTNGVHSIRFIVCDATELNCSSTGESSFVVDNTPFDSVPPSIAGTPAVGSKLTADPGRWIEQSPGSFKFHWLRCPADFTAPRQCEQTDGLDETYVPVQADVGKRLLVDVTNVVAAPGQASADAFSPATEVVRPTTKGGQGTAGSPLAPQTRIAKHPRAKSGARLAKFAFLADQPDARFQCKLDKAAFRACGSPFKARVRPGAHVLQVQAVGNSGIVDPTPARFRWRVLAHRR